MWKKVTLVAFLILVFGFLVYKVFFAKPKVETVYVDKKIDSLVYVRDTIYKEIEVSKYKIKTIDHWYEKKRDSLITQPVDSDCVFFTNYLSENPQ